MRILAALTAVALAILPVQAQASTHSAAPEQTKSETDADQVNEGQAASTPSAEPAAANKKKPTEQTAAQSGVSAEPKPDRSVQASSDEREASPSKS